MLYCDVTAPTMLAARCHHVVLRPTWSTHYSSHHVHLLIYLLLDWRLAIVGLCWYCQCHESRTRQLARPANCRGLLACVNTSVRWRSCRNAVQRVTITAFHWKCIELLHVLVVQRILRAWRERWSEYCRLDWLIMSW